MLAKCRGLENRIVFRRGDAARPQCRQVVDLGFDGEGQAPLQIFSQRVFRIGTIGECLVLDSHPEIMASPQDDRIDGRRLDFQQQPRMIVLDALVEQPEGNADYRNRGAPRTDDLDDRLRGGGDRVRLRDQRSFGALLVVKPLQIRVATAVYIVHSLADNERPHRLVYCRQGRAAGVSYLHAKVSEILVLECGRLGDICRRQLRTNAVFQIGGILAGGKHASER